MTRINTNVSSLTAQKTLARSNAQLQTALNRLSTGLRINAGKDDPAGLIASEALRSNIASANKAITNTQRANQMIATADSALGQVSSLLTDIRGLVTEAANTGAMSAEQISANQLQVDSSLEAINRISQTTSFQGKRLLDGSLDFITGSWTNQATVTDLSIDQANLGTTGSMAVTVDITAAADQAKITATVPDSVAAVKATTKITFAQNDYITVTAATAGADSNGITIDIVESASYVANTATAFYDEANKSIKVYVNDAADVTMANLNNAIDGLAEVSSVYTQNGAANANYAPGGEAPTQAVLGDATAGADAVTGLTGDLVFELKGTKGTQAFSFEQNSTGAQMAAAINLVTDATGVSASFAANTLTLLSTDYGSNAFIEIKEISDAGAFTPSASRDTGSDIVATVNGVAAKGDGNTLSVSTATLSMNATVTDGSTADLAFTISGGGAQFQLGPDVVSNQQARMGIQSVSTASLGGKSGRLYTLGSGGTAALATDATTAASIVNEVITKVTSLRGRLGAFQKTTLDSNVSSLTDTVENLTAAESAIRDADYASESAALTRAQILVQAGTSVLSVANQNPQNVLALLRG